MPTYYEGAPIITEEQELSEDVYRRAWEVYQTRKGAMRRREVKLFFLIGAALLIAIWTPVYQQRYHSFWLPVCAIIVCLVLVVHYLVLVPRAVTRHAGEVYHSNKLIGMKSMVTVFRDSFTVKNAHETLNGHWTDFTECIETPELFVAFPGWDRTLFVIDKAGLTADEIIILSEHFSATFVSKYRVVKK